MSGLMLISPLLVMSAIFVRHVSFKCVISGGLDSEKTLKCISHYIKTLSHNEACDVLPYTI